MEKRILLQMTADIVASHTSMNELSQEDLLAEINQVYNRLAGLAGQAELEAPEAGAKPEEIKSAVSFKAVGWADKETDEDMERTTEALCALADVVTAASAILHRSADRLDRAHETVSESFRRMDKLRAEQMALRQASRQ